MKCKIETQLPRLSSTYTLKLELELRARDFVALGAAAPLLRWGFRSMHEQAVSRSVNEQLAAVCELLGVLIGKQDAQETEKQTHVR